MRDAVFIVASHVQIGSDKQCVPRLEAEVATERTHESADGDERGGDEDRADGDLGDEQRIAQSEAAGACGAAHAGANDLPWIGAHDLANGHDAA